MNKASISRQALNTGSLPPVQGMFQHKCAACGNHTPAGIRCSVCNKGSRANSQSTAIRRTTAGPGLDNYSNRSAQPLAFFEERGNKIASESRHTASTEASITGVPTAQPPAAAAARQTVIRGDFPRVSPSEYWFFDGETPANYTVSTVLSTNRSGGAFSWNATAQLALSSLTDPRPTVTSAAPSAANKDAVISVRHTDAGGTSTAASYRVTVLAPKSLTHLRNVDNPIAGLGYESEIHYSIHDQFGTVLPNNVPLNEDFTGPAIQDFPGGNWTRPPACGAGGVCGTNFNPADWHDRVTGEGDVGAVPAPVAPGSPGAGVAAEHWPGDWRIGSGVIGSGRRVRTVTWQRNRGFARHT